MAIPRVFSQAALALLLAALPSAPPLRGARLQADRPTADRRVVIFSPNARDGRIARTREAIMFWNQTLADLKVPLRLVEAGLIAASPMTRTLETYARQVAMRAEGLAPAGEGPRAPRQLATVAGDIFVFLSTQDILSVTRPLDPATRFFVVIQTDRGRPPLSPNVVRNVIAHELGHALGLVHNGDATSLMCGPCAPFIAGLQKPVFSPLTPEDRARLLELHPPTL